ncbi:molybdate ABC transporter substrate-binding protein [Luteimonas yindakuii]|uniref:molybdate ABC transporter substrate-binding protein n=1 Tax=Luteimonas yindakuii TaxID=2565782 RepID=UPI0010A40D42|nr:molybdate ABC transporter substrate-binding protein [Luteimonas yindakuii]QCO67170.1 molybdate ABC transporter substrate-binding protein [Luteimonas yindakuii]
MRLVRRLAAMLVLLALLAGCVPRGKDADTAPALTVFAAASLKDAMDVATEGFHAQTGQLVRVSYAASPALARQIDRGAPADVFVSADLAWMDWLQQRGHVAAGDRHVLFGNTLVLVAHAGGDTSAVALAPGTDLVARLHGGRLALATTASVPAGRYAKAALQSLSLWDGVAAHVAETDNVRAALMLVARGEAPLGVVYASDALAEPSVRVVATFPPGSHPPIVYPAARIARSTHAQAAAFVDWLQTPAAQAIFRARGFTAP